MSAQSPASLGTRTDLELQRAEQALAAAVSALAGYEHLRTTRARLTHDLTAAEAHVQHLAYELMRERNDVIERSSGVIGFLYGLVGDAQLSIEQREALEAEARLGEATAGRDHLRAQLASLDAQLAGQSAPVLAANVASLRATKEEILIRGNHPAGVALRELAVWIQSIEIELIPLDDALSSGEKALGKLQG
ncbi:MAG: hypothetical protein H0V17_05675, partial [Deltaproteobacteria bacterium]|nr:hypothetical protein [Deltaproteobacteria bacterium]